MRSLRWPYFYARSRPPLLPARTTLWMVGSSICEAKAMDLQLKDKVVIVTGGAKGIGAAIVRACAGEGAIPIIVGRDAEAGSELQAEVRKSGGECGLISVDLGTAQACEKSVAKTIQEFGRMDALVNNAGRNDKVGLEQGSPTEYIESLNRNLVHYYSMGHYALPHL